MMRGSWHHTVLLLTAATATAGCRSRAEGRDELAGILEARAARIEAALAPDAPVATDAAVARWILPEPLREISGQVLTSDGRLLVHGDEVATIYEIDYRHGTIVKDFSLGSPAIRGDFEAITAVGDTLFLLTSDGMLYRFAEGGPSTTVPYTRVDTNLGDRCEFEGMTYDAAINALVLACKKVRDKTLDDMLVLFRWPLGPDATGTATQLPLLTVPFDALVGNRDWKQFEPSDITINPATGNYLIVASLQHALAEISPAGEVVMSRLLPPGHPQAEGLAITKDGLLLVSDEATNEPAALTAYRWQP